MCLSFQGSVNEWRSFAKVVLKWRSFLMAILKRMVVFRHVVSRFGLAVRR